MGRRNGQRRARGEGTVYKIVVRGRAVWRAELQWTDAEGIEQRRSAQRASESKARLELDRWRLEKSTNGVVSTSRALSTTVGTALKDYIAEAKISVRPSTSIWHATIAKHFSNLADRRITSLRRSDIRALAERDDLSPRLKQAIHRLLKAVLSRQPLARARWDELFPSRSTPRVTKREMRPWSASEAQIFLDLAKDDAHYTLYVLALATGARLGEILGLRWGDIHETAITVSRALHASDDRETKTKSSRRRIDIPPPVSATLAEHREALIRLGLPVGPESPVFGSTKRPGEPLNPSGVSHAWADLMRALSAHLPVITFHDLRHTHASLLLLASVHPKVVQERLGHSSITMTLDTYSHLIPTMQADASLVVGEALFSKVPDHKLDGALGEK